MVVAITVFFGWLYTFSRD